MNLLIPLRTTSPNNYYELRFALRSISLQHPIERCLLVGGKPDWYLGEHLTFSDYKHERKEENIRDKVIAGAAELGPDVDFLFANDDHFLLKPCTSVYNKGLISDTLKGRQSNGSYTRLLRNTLILYGDIPNADTHCPMMMNTSLVAGTNFAWPEYGYGFKTTYCQVNGISSEYQPDNKVRDILDVKKNWPYFSTYEDVKNLIHLSVLFGKKSIFER